MSVGTPTIRESLEELETLQRVTTKTNDYQRLTVLIWFKKGVVTTKKQAADLLGVHRNTISNWLEKYEREGLQGYRFPVVGRPASQRALPPEVFEALRERVHDPDGGFDSYVEAERWVAQEHGFEVKYSTLYALMRREFGTRLKAPRPSHPKKTPKKSASSENNSDPG